VHEATGARARGGGGGGKMVTSACADQGAQGPFCARHTLAYGRGQDVQEQLRRTTLSWGNASAFSHLCRRNCDVLQDRTSLLSESSLGGILDRHIKRVRCRRAGLGLVVCGCGRRPPPPGGGGMLHGEPLVVLHCILSQGAL
jgi:hypothetical protein